MSELVVLDESAVKRLKKAVNTDRDLVIWVGDWLFHLNMFSDAQIYGILEYIKPELEAQDELLRAGLDRRIGTLAVCESRWVSYTGLRQFYDTETAELVPELGAHAVTHIMCDVSALWHRMRYRQGRFNGKASSRQSTPDIYETGQ